MKRIEETANKLRSLDEETEELVNYFATVFDESVENPFRSKILFIQIIADVYHEIQMLKNKVNKKVN